MKVSDVELVNVEYAPALKVLRALYMGIEVQLGNYNCRLAKTEGNGEMIVVRCVEPKDHIIGWPLSLEGFTQLCNALPEETMIEITNKIGHAKWFRNQEKRRYVRTPEF